MDGLGVGDVQDVALRDRRHLSEDGVLIVVATLTGRTAPWPAARADRARLRRAGRAAARGDARRGPARARRPDQRQRDRDQAPPGAPARRPRAADLRPHGPTPDDSSCSSRGMSTVRARAGVGGRSRGLRRRHRHRRAPDPAAARLRGLLPRVLPAARALEPRRRGAVDCGRPPGGTAARGGPSRNGARRARGSARPLPARARAGDERRAGPGTAHPGPPSCSNGRRCCTARACASRRRASPRHTSSWPSPAGAGGPRRRGAGSAPRPTARSLWAGLFDLRENLLGRRSRTCAPRRVAAGLQLDGCRLGQPRPRRAVRAPAAAGGDAHRRHVRALSRREGREPGRGGGPARRGRDASSAAWPRTISPRRR